MRTQIARNNPGAADWVDEKNPRRMEIAIAGGECGSSVYEGEVAATGVAWFVMARNKLTSSEPANGLARKASTPS